MTGSDRFLEGGVLSRREPAGCGNGESEDEVFSTMFRVLRDFPAAREAMVEAFQGSNKEIGNGEVEEQKGEGVADGESARLCADATGVLAR